MPPAELLRARATNNPTSSSVGPKPNTIVCHSGVPVSTACAFTVTFLAISSLERPSSPDVGRTVWHFALDLTALPGDDGASKLLSAKDLTERGRRRPRP